MSWMGKVIGGTFGFMVAGPVGALIGASVGHKFDQGVQGIDRDAFSSKDTQHQIQMAFFNATFSVMGHLAKADGVVSTAEINLAKRIMDEMQLSPELRSKAIELFQQGKQPDFPLEAVLTKFRQECRRRQHLIHMFLEIQMQAAFADGALGAIEENMLLRICANLGISRFEYQAIKMQFQAQQRFYQYGSHQNNNRVNIPNRQSNLNDAYAVLGLKPSATDEAVTKAYRRLISQHHPDKLVAKGLPEEMMTLAKEKTQQIRKAYETIRASREKPH